ncbi:hypothetical protein [Methylacidiphilum caldifontis]|uniref:Chromosome partition protein Smc n=1 Tax=Methylacidiphilum caldifontis TaxID=2795386 RepID=A0A4Y8PAA9_9BACT|nr:hypothetical protein [Methylacidiphilum caldifontis]TFE67767.1 hypothetical protein A7Q10_09090 [Methylacidiphilum caldifontis]
MPVEVEELVKILKLLREHPEWKEEIRKEILTEEFLHLPAVFEKENKATKESLQQLTSTVDSLVKVQEKTEKALHNFMESTDKRFQSIETELKNLAKAQERTETNLNILSLRLNALTQIVDTLAQRLDSLAQRVDTLTQRVDSLTQIVDTLAQRLDSLTQRVDSLTQRVDSLAEAQKKTEKTLHDFMVAADQRFSRIENDLAELKKNGLETQLKMFPGSYLGIFLKKAKLIDPSDIPNIRNEDHDELSRADAIVEGISKYNSGKKIVVVIEISWRAHADDIEKAFKRAEIMLKYFQPSLPMVYSEQIPEEVVLRKAKDSKVVILTKNKNLYWEEPIEYWENR